LILFRNVKWKNLLSTGNNFTEIKLDNRDNTLVVGENGSGKSTLLDALCFGLFGKAFRSINKPNLVNSINQKDCIVEVEFDTNNKSYKIIRGIKPNKFEIYCNGDMINQEAASRDYQDFLERFVLKMNYKSFTQIVILGSASFTPFMQLSASDRRTIIEDLLDIQIFSTMNGLVKDRLSNNKDLIANQKHEIDLTQQKYDLKKKHIDELKQTNEDKVKEYDTEIQCHSDTISSLLSNVATLTSETEELQLVVASKIDTETKQKLVDELKNSKVGSETEEQQLKVLKDSLSTLQSNLKDLIEEKTYYETASNLLRDSGIKTKIVRQYLPIINKLVNKYLASLDFFVNFNLDESFKETIKSRHRDDFSYHNFSEGEKQRIDMALMLTWRAIAKLKNSSNTNLLILDETFDSSLDTNGTEELMKLLHMLEDVNLFVISHKGDILQDKFMNVIRFEKVKNFSRMVK
jgi:DNA repair exonuclease SbcCD ATPase subunit